MTISVAIPCYNGEQHIAGCVNSILNQTVLPEEIIVVNDGSTDNSVEIIRNYPVKLINHRSNLGLSFARNTALETAKTKYILYVDTDAYADSKLVETILENFLSSEVAGVGGRGIEKVQLTVEDKWRAYHASQGYGDFYKERCLHLFGLCMAYRCDVLREVGGFDSLYRTNAEDVDIGYRLVNKGYVLKYDPRAIVYHHRQDDFVSLKKAMYGWYYWGYIAKRKNDRQPWRLFFGTFKRLLITDTIPDLFREERSKLFYINLCIFGVKIKALMDAAKSKV